MRNTAVLRFVVKKIHIIIINYDGILGVLSVRLHRVHTGLDEYLATFKEGAETPTVLSGRGQRESQLAAPFYDI